MPEAVSTEDLVEGYCTGTVHVQQVKHQINVLIRALLRIRHVESPHESTKLAALKFATCVGVPLLKLFDQCRSVGH